VSYARDWVIEHVGGSEVGLLLKKEWMGMLEKSCLKEQSCQETVWGYAVGCCKATRDVK